jgi:hypothetical protein
VEQLESAQVKLASIVRSIRSRQITGVEELNIWANGGLLPTATAFGRIIRFLSKVYDSNKGVLGVDVGATATTVVAALSGELVQSVYTQLCLGNGVTGLLKHSTISEVHRWLHLEISKDYVREYIYNKALYPNSLPATPEDLAIEQALARQLLQVSWKQISNRISEIAKQSGKSLLPGYEPILVSGSVFTRAPNLAQSLLTLLDGLQPIGVTTVVLDQHHTSPALGVAAAVNPVLVVQVLESSTFLNLATVISPVGYVRPGTPILRLRMTDEDGKEIGIEVKQGSLEVIQLPVGKSAQVHLQPLHRYDVGMGGPGRGGRLRVVGGSIGVVIDARGRPLRLIRDDVRRRESINKWRSILGC